VVTLSKETSYCPTSLYLSEGAVKDLTSQDRGGFGVVYAGKFGSRMVAVKVLKQESYKDPNDFNKSLCKEAIVWRHLRHPNCLPFYGVYRIPGRTSHDTALVSPWMHHGNLRKYLQFNPNANRTMLTLDVVRGLHYLHSMQPHVAHRDLKPDNVLVTEQGRACLADFGFTSTFDQGPQFHTAPGQLMMGGTMRYMAPELHEAVNEEARRQVNKRACDMYAFGCTIYATYTGKDPFHGLTQVQIISHLARDERPSFPEDVISPEMWSFVENLWSSDPFERLTAEKALAWMEHKAAGEGIDTSAPTFEKEWEWKACNESRGGSFCSVSLD
ncbi:hypothetical protein PAXINDRAFT_91731, partial [Paxillus involutus ATCC 200175]